MKFLHRIIFCCLLFVPFALIGQKIPGKPNPPKLVNDLAGVLSDGEVATLEKKLVAYDDSTSNQIAVVIVETLDDYPIEEYALKLFREWGIGNRETNNGVLLLVASKDRSVRIEPGYGLEGAIPDITATQIINSDIVPAFRGGNYYEGLDKATNSIMAAAAGEYTPPEGYGSRGMEKGFPIGLIILIIILVIIMSNNKRGGGGFMSRRGFGPVIFPGGFGGGGSSWGGGGGGFGGGFGGFGGGSSGGGGASGRW